MPKQTESPLYATLFYEIRRELNVTWGEYIYLDMVYHLSHDGWCYKSLENIAYDMGMRKSGVVKLRDRLIEQGLIKKSKYGYVKTTDMYHKVIRTDKKPYHFGNAPYHKVEQTVPLSGTKNYLENNNRKETSNSGYEKAKSMAELLKTKRYHKTNVR